MQPSEPPERAFCTLRKVRLEDADNDDHDLSATTTMAERLEMMWELAKLNWLFMGQPQDAARLQRHVVRLERRGS